jgi:hypothetical protein
MPHSLDRRPLTLPASTLLLGLGMLPAVALAENISPDTPSLKLALDLGGTVGPMRHPASTLPPSPLGDDRYTPARKSAARVTVGTQVALSQFFNVSNLWETNTLDWYLAGRLRAFSLRIGLEKEVPLSPRFSLGLAAHGAAAEVSMGTSETTFVDAPNESPTNPDSTPPANAVGELRAHQWLYGLGGTVSLLVLTDSPVYFRLQAGYLQYFDKAQHFELHGKDITPVGFAVSLSGPSGGLSVGVRL